MVMMMMTINHHTAQRHPHPILDEKQRHILLGLEYIHSWNNKGIRDAGSTADFRILFEILKFKNLKIWKMWKILEHLKKFRTFGKFWKVFKIWKNLKFFRKFRKFSKIEIFWKILEFFWKFWKQIGNFGKFGKFEFFWKI